MNPTTDFSIRSIKGGYDDNFTYIVTCSHTGSQLIIDAAINLGIISPYLRQEPAALFITHSHGDHIAHINDYVGSFPKLSVVCHPNSSVANSEWNTIPIDENQSINVGQLTFKAIHTPGHYFDSICFQLENVLFTGDTLFVGRTGRTISERSSIKDLYSSVYDKILTLPGNTRIYPGHDYGPKASITLDENKEISPLLNAEGLDDFVHRMDEYEKNRTIGS